MIVADWISYDDAEGREESCGGLGGWFGFEDHKHHRWSDYIVTCQPAARPYVEAVRTSVLAEDRFITGHDHQNDPEGVPLFDDGTVGMFTFRAWGDLMAAIATEKDGQDHNYMEFYC